MNLNPTIKLDDGRIVKRPSGEKTVIATGEYVCYHDFHTTYFMGQHWEFTGRIRYESNPNWDETLIYYEIVHVWKDSHPWMPWKIVDKIKLDWIREVDYKYGTTITYAECDQS